MKTIEQVIQHNTISNKNSSIDNKFLPEKVFGSDDRYYIDFSEKAERVNNICLKFDLEKYQSDFRRLYTISTHINYLKDNVSDKYGDLKVYEYKKQLTELFNILNTTQNNDIAKIDFLTIKYTKSKMDRSGGKSTPTPGTLKIDNEQTIKDIRALILNHISVLYMDKPFDNLLADEKEILSNQLEQFNELAKIKARGGALNQSYYLKRLAKDIVKFIEANNMLKDQTQTKKHEFIGELFNAFEIKKPTNGTDYAKMIFNIINAK